VPRTDLAYHSGVVHAQHGPGKRVNSPAQVLFASLIGTTIEFFDFYIYANAAVLVFPKLFFPKSDPASALLASLATFAIAFLARPIGSALFGHFGDRVGRKTTLVAALLTMGLSTMTIGILPTYASIGIAAPLFLALCRFGQGLGLGGEWGGAVLLAVENAPPGKRAWYGMFPQLGAPIGFLFSGGVFLLLSSLLTDQQFFDFGWRIPFLASAALVVLGLYVRLTITETPVFQKIDRRERAKVPMWEVLRRHFGTLVLGVLISHPVVRHPVFRADDSVVRAPRRDRSPPDVDLGQRADGAVRLRDGAALPGRHVRRGRDDGPRHGDDGAGIRPARDGAVGALSDGRALFGQLADVQSRRNLRRLARAVRRDVAGAALRAAVRRLLLVRRVGPFDRRAAGDARNQGHAPLDKPQTLSARALSEDGQSVCESERHQRLRRCARTS
jgi:hypothetical protein